MKILNFGSCNVDYVYSLDHIVRVGETEATYRRDVFAGGKGLNQSIAIARAGAEVYHAGCIGSDGELLKDILCDSGVDVSYLRTVDAPNGHAIIQVSDKGENSIFLYGGSNEMITESFVDEVLSAFEKGDIIVLQNEINDVDYIVRKAYEKGMSVVLNPSPFNEKISKIDFEMISYLILNEVEAGEITQAQTPEESLVFFKKNYPSLKIMLTLGEKGCVFMDGEFQIWQPSFKVDVVDTTAAGDTFTGYFVSELAKGTPYATVLKIASAASAIAVSRNGAAPSIPLCDEVMSVIDGLVPAENGARENAIIESVSAYIENNLAAATLCGLAENLGYSVSYTAVLVKKVFGKSFSKLLQDRRCAVAADKLLNTELSVGEIINLVGYENESFFRRAFKEKYGKNPLDFRKKG